MAGKLKHDMVGRTIGRLTVVRRDVSHYFPYWICQCTCGNSKSVDTKSLLVQKIKSCGCLAHEIYQDLTGQKFGRLTVIRRGKAVARRVYWLCRCQCGKEVDVLADTLKNGRSQSCGCRNKEVQRVRLTTHGHTGSPEYHSWLSMIQRCDNPKATGYKRYGGRGIKIAPELRQFETFLALLGPRPAGTSLDRINNDGHYEPGNVRWADAGTQAKNTSRSTKNRPTGA
jgi:hypothetical protein